MTPPRAGLELQMQVLSEDPSDPVDSKGGVHMVYPAYAVGDAFYAYCPANCSALDEASIVKLPTQGTVDNAMLALDSGGKPHVLLSTYQRVYYATCTGDCRQEHAWTVSVVLEHNGDYEVSGEAFALDPQGRPRFLMHPYRSLSPIGKPGPAAYLVTCDGNCQDTASWTHHQVSSQLWQESSLRYPSNGALTSPPPSPSTVSGTPPPTSPAARTAPPRTAGTARPSTTASPTRTCRKSSRWSRWH